MQHWQPAQRNEMTLLKEQIKKTSIMSKKRNYLHISGRKCTKHDFNGFNRVEFGWSKKSVEKMR